jgi:MFS family permease
VTVVRRFAIVVIVAASVVTAVVGGVFAGLAIDYPSESERLWRLLFGVTGVAAAVAGSVCAYFAARDLRRGSLSPRARRWTWTATVAFTLFAFSTVWWFYFGLVGPLVTALFVRLAEPRDPGHPRGGGQPPGAPLASL